MHISIAHPIPIKLDILKTCKLAMLVPNSIFGVGMNMQIVTASPIPCF